MISPATAAFNIAARRTAPCSSGPSNGTQISVNGRIIVNDTDLAVRAAVDGLGIAYVIEAVADPFLRSGQLVRVLEN
jgi:DNA-binding transcriptional LysR family regulator